MLEKNSRKKKQLQKEESTTWLKDRKKETERRICKRIKQDLDETEGATKR